MPATGKLDPVGAFIMFGGIYYGAMYGSSTTSILLNTPGENSSVVTAIEGHQMAKNGRGAAALATAAIGSFVAGTLATFALALFAPVVVQFALQFGPADYFALMLLAFTTVTAVLGSSMLRGVASLLFGLAIGLVGIDMQTGQARLTLGLPQLLDGIPVVILAVGLFAVGEALFVVSRAIARQRDHRAGARARLDDRRGMEALLEAVAARRRHRIPVRHAAGGRRRDPDLPLLCGREEAQQASGGIRQRRDRRRRRARRPPTIRR